MLFALSLLATAVSSQYCGGGPTSALDSNLGAVTFEDITNANDCPGQIGVQDFTSSVAEISAGEEYTMTYAVTTCGGTYTRVSNVWIDFNGDETYTDDEQLQDPVVTSAATQVVSVTFTVPTDAVSGDTRMRVVVSERATPVLAPCDPFGYGGVKEFGISIGGGSGGAGGLSGGSWFLVIVFAIFLPIYLIGGAAWGHKQGKNGIDLVPNLAFWKEFAPNVMAGCTITLNKIKALTGGKTEEYGEI